jgi:hypothetical protein
MLNYLKSAMHYYNIGIEICQVPVAKIPWNLENFKVAVGDYWRHKRAGERTLSSPSWILGLLGFV